MLTGLFATLDPFEGEGRLDGSGGPGGPTGDTGEPDLAQQPVMARRKRVCPCCHGTGEHPSGFECYRCDSSGSLGGDDPGAGGCDGAGGSMSSTAAGRIGEPSYEEDDGYTRRMWDNWHPKLPDTIHRALGVTIPADHPANDTSRPMSQRAHSLLGDLSNHLEGRGGLGMHWTSDPAHLKKHLADRLAPGETPVLLHARTPPREHIEDNGWVHEDRAIRDWDTDEREVPVKRNAPLHVTGITWGGNHHDFEEPVTKRAAREPYTEDLANDGPVSLPYHRRTEKAPNVGSTYGQDIEPHGQYFTPSALHESLHGDPGFEHGIKSFKRPLRLYSPTDDAQHPDHWKQQLTRRYPGKKGKSLSQAIRNDGYDAILTHDDYGPSESVDLRHLLPRTASGPVTADDDERNIHRGFTTVLPPDVHKFVHDPAQPAAARAHMLLAHVRKAKPEINSEEAVGTTGGLGNFWSPMKHKGSEYADQTGFKARNDHAREHGCWDEYGDGGCPTTNVVLHAGEPHEKHQWKEEFRDGERYDRNLSWRLPIRPGAPLHVKGISWREGNDHLPRDYNAPYEERDKRGPYTEHDFPTPVKKRAGWSDNEVPSGARGRDHQGHEVEMTPQDGWAHLDGSHGEDDGSTVSDHPVTAYEHVHTWLPQGRYWGPNSGHNDQRLFQGDRLRPEVREDILHRVGTYLRRYEGWTGWAKVYFAGSEAAQWEPFNGDFDVIVGIDWPRFLAENPKEAGHSPQELAEHMTDGMWHSINAKGYFFDLADGTRVGPFDRTFFVNDKAWDIRALHPYAAYDVTDDTWAVRPLQVPKDWSAQSLPESYWAYAEAMAKAVEAIGELPAEERHRMAANLWEEIHTHRSDAFADGGHGLYDLANVVEKYLDQHPGGLWDKLTAWKNHAPGGTEPWMPSTAGLRERVSALLRFGEVRRDPQGHTGIMVALVPPRRVAKELYQQGGEPVESMHVTLAYLGNKAEYSEAQLKALPDLVKGWAAGRSPLKASIGGAGAFVNPDQHVLWAAVDIPHGTVFRDDLVRHLEGHGYNIRHDHGWTPHMTLAYSSTHVRFLPKITPRTWRETEVWVCIGGRWESFPIGS